jgi:hypothetical protein
VVSAQCWRSSTVCSTCTFVTADRYVVCSALTADSTHNHTPTSPSVRGNGNELERRATICNAIVPQPSRLSSSFLPQSLFPSLLPHFSSYSHTHSSQPCNLHISHGGDYSLAFNAGRTGCKLILLQADILALHQVAIQLRKWTSIALEVEVRC